MALTDYTKFRSPIPFDEINRAALSALPTLLVRWFSAGRIEGKEFCIGSIRGEPGRSLKINLRTGVWCDFAAGTGGSDPVSLAAAIAGMGQAEAAKQLALCLGVSVND